MLSRPTIVTTVPPLMPPVLTALNAMDDFDIYGAIWLARGVTWNNGTRLVAPENAEPLSIVTARGNFAGSTTASNSGKWLDTRALNTELSMAQHRQSLFSSWRNPRNGGAVRRVHQGYPRGEISEQHHPRRVRRCHERNPRQRFGYLKSSPAEWCKCKRTSTI
jgi:hypothetical protein